MANKGLDTTFIHFGIRKADMNLIETLCTSYQLDFEWVKEEILREFHERKIRNLPLEDKDIEKLLEKALSKIK